MKKFLSKILIYISVLLIIVLGINTIYIRAERKLDLYNLGDLAGEVPDNIQICNFGSSHGQGDFNYTDLRDKYTCFNFALAAQTYLYDYKILQNYKSKIQKGVLVFIPVSYFSFLGVPETQKPDFASKNSRYYKFLPAEFIEQYDLISDIFINYFPALLPDNIRMFVERLYKPDESFFESGTDGRNAEARYKEHLVYGKFDENGKRIYNYEAVEALYRMIEELKGLKARIILITTPFIRGYNDAVKNNDPDFLREFHGIIKEIVKKTGVEYLDYSQDERYTDDYSIFVDADHLNKRGARIFTDNLIKEIFSHPSSLTTTRPAGTE